MRVFLLCLGLRMPSPCGYCFDEAALKTEPGLRIRIHDQNGRRVYDEWTLVTSTFRLSDLKGD